MDIYCAGNKSCKTIGRYEEPKVTTSMEKAIWTESKEATAPDARPSTAKLPEVLAIAVLFPDVVPDKTLEK